MGVRPAAIFASHRFAVRQDRVGMKVGIDGIVLGAVAGRAALPVLNAHGASSDVFRALDVGCGCGIVALLLRQAACRAGRQAHITALDIDAPAVDQARENVAESPWPADFDVRHSSLQEYVSLPSLPDQRFDLVVSNPPYFPRPPRHVEMHSATNRANQLICSGGRTLEAPDEALWPQSRAHARFREYLPPLDLMRGAAALLAPHGSFWCVYPASEEKVLLRAAQAAGLHQRSRLAIKFKAGLPEARVVWSFDCGSQSPAEEAAAATREALASPPVEEVLVVRHDDKTYTQDFVNLTQMCYGQTLPTVQ